MLSSKDCSPQEGRMKKTLSLIGLFLCAAIILSECVSIHNSRAADSPKITIAYSGSVMGYLEPCG
jgi:hypothetical protein